MIVLGNSRNFEKDDLLMNDPPNPRSLRSSLQVSNFAMNKDKPIIDLKLAASPMTKLDKHNFRFLKGDPK